jgi:hypothetical protein
LNTHAQVVGRHLDHPLQFKAMRSGCIRHVFKKPQAPRRITLLQRLIECLVAWRSLNALTPERAIQHQPTARQQLCAGTFEQANTSCPRRNVDHVAAHDEISLGRLDRRRPASLRHI